MCKGKTNTCQFFFYFFYYAPFPNGPILKFFLLKTRSRPMCSGVIFLLRFNSGKCDLTQTLLRRLVKKMVSGASAFGLFQSEKPLFRGVPGVSRCLSLVRICPRDRFRSRKNFFLAVTLQRNLPRHFVISFIEVFSLIFTQPA